jgi:hypothetical protein
MNFTPEKTAQETRGSEASLGNSCFAGLESNELKGRTR